jgi:predicted Zn-dependent protease
LVLAPRLASANGRLGQIELSRGQYPSARTHLEAAFAATPGRQSVAQLHGESLAITGDVDGAAAVWRPLALDADQLLLREAWYRLIGEAQRADWIRDAAARARQRQAP